MTFKLVKLTDVCEKITDGSHFSPKTKDSGYPYITVRDLENDAINFQSCRYVDEADFIELRRNGCSPKLNDLLFSKDGTVGKVALVNSSVDFVVLSSLAILTPKLNLINPSFLFYVLKSPYFLSAAIGKKTGVAIRRIILKNLKEIIVPLPPLSTQQKIVAKLDAIFAEIDKATAAAEANAKNAEALFQAYLRQVFESNSEFKNVEIGEVCTIVNGGTPKSEIGEYWDGELNWITPKEMGKLNSREITNTERKITEKGLKNSSAKLLPINSVILSSRAPIGHLAINKSLMATNQGCKGLVPSNSLHYEFLYYFLLHSKQLLNDMGSGATFKELSGSKLATVEIPLPPLATQHTIVAKLDALSSEINKSTKSHTDKVYELAKLRQSILKTAFSGELVKE